MTRRARVPDDCAAVGIQYRTIPEFSASYLVDDPDSPTEVTIFAGDESDLATRWVTIDYQSAVPQEEWR
jgi:hypothetical protein